MQKKTSKPRTSFYIVCVQVSIDLKLGGGETAEVVMMQSKVNIQVGSFNVKFDKGSYPQPKSSVIDGVEVFKVYFSQSGDFYVQNLGIFLISTIFKRFLRKEKLLPNDYPLRLRYFPEFLVEQLSSTIKS